MKILLVDDDPLLAEATAKLIQCLGGHEVCITDEPTEVFQLCESGNIDLVIMDINLPGARWKDQLVSGADLSRLLKTQTKTANLPIVLVTAYAMLNEQQEFMKISLADGLFAKPITDFDSFLEFLLQCQRKEA